MEDAMKTKIMMTGEVRTCGPDTNLCSVIETMSTYHCGILPVVNERGQAIGILTDRDICVALGSRDAQPSSLVARNVMTQPVIGCAPEDDCYIALLTMEQHRVHRLPVLGIGGVVMGIVSIDDIVRWAAGAPTTDPLRVAVLEVLAGIGARSRPGPAIAGA
jgi:CBS domain-containing protein